ncbi:MAG: radical SAM family heme chaperone HemW [Muribaculaceae bacterium]|nr:radical SAM family heme chaperone HemW [Muribaculaceae bacterium]
MAGLYIHVPFCHSKCAYCDFYSRPLSVRDAMSYIDAVGNELESRRGELCEEVKTVYIGGGTPSCLPAEAFEKLLTLLPESGVEEFTVEANPEDITADFLNMLRGSAVNRISMGVQSLNDSELRAVGRRHTAADAIRAARLIADAGFNMSLDLIYGLPGQTLQSWEESLKGVIGVRPQHLSCYLLSYEPGTRLYAMRLAGKVTEATEEVAEEMYRHLTATAAAAGYNHYEISNFALPGFEARHNSAYWNMTPYLGLGPGAHSFDGHTRRFNPPDMAGYLKAGGVGITKVDSENDSERFNDFVITALRTSSGLDLNLCEVLFGRRRRKNIENTAAPLIRRGVMWMDGNHTGICESHWLRSDAVMIEFIEV